MPTMYTLDRLTDPPHGESTAPTVPRRLDWSSTDAESIEAHTPWGVYHCWRNARGARADFSPVPHYSIVIADLRGQTLEAARAAADTHWIRSVAQCLMPAPGASSAAPATDLLATQEPTPCPPPPYCPPSKPKP
jgi:hypothetical protein